MTGKPRTLYEKIWDAHVIERREHDTSLIFIDRHLVHEVTSPQAFEALRLNGRKVRRPELTLAVPDHNLPTTARIDADGNRVPIADAESSGQLDALERNAPAFGVRYFGATSREQGIVHVVGPEQGFSLPGTTIVCGDSHTAAHGGVGALAFGIGTSEVEHVLATQTLLLKQSQTMEVRVEGDLGPGITSKDLILHIIGVIGTAGGNGHVIEYRGRVFEQMSVEGRLTVCNMSIEGGARAGLIAPDDITFAYLKGRPLAPKGEEWDQAVAYWRTLRTDDGATFDKSIVLDASELEPMVTWGNNPGMGVPITGRLPRPEEAADDQTRRGLERAFEYMALTPGDPIAGHPVDVVFIGSCTNSRISDLRLAASVLKDRHAADNVRLMIVPGSQQVKAQAEREGLHEIFRAAGADWRESGCSMCIAMNGDLAQPGQLVVATSNRNFEGRQGKGARTVLASPLVAAASAVAGRVTDPREYMTQEVAA